jgi:hypothetical protein
MSIRRAGFCFKGGRLEISSIFGVLAVGVEAIHLFDARGRARFSNGMGGGYMLKKEQKLTLVEYCLVRSDASKKLAIEPRARYAMCASERATLLMFEIEK